MKEVIVAMILPFCAGFVVGMAFLIAIVRHQLNDEDVDRYNDYDEDEEKYINN